ncbi:MAG: hypothetical protein SWQ30_13870 [Thermodesulfobacteriota bacterium]|nr:hypothetical protein [Thermodesulfobacteriota bacterium]
MKDDGLGNIFFRHMVMAIPWGIVLLVVFFVAAVGIKQQIKEGIQYTVRMAISETAGFAYHYKAAPALKQNIKEGIEFAGMTASRELKGLLNDPQVKQDLEEAFKSGK